MPSENTEMTFQEIVGNYPTLQHFTGRYEAQGELTRIFGD